MLLRYDHREERKQIGEELALNIKKCWEDLFVSAIGSSGHWRLKGVCRIAEPVALEGRDGAGISWY